MKPGITITGAGDVFEAFQSRDPNAFLKIVLKQQYNATVKDGPPPAEKSSIFERFFKKLNKHHKEKPDYFGLRKKPIWLSDEEKMKLFQDPRVEKDVYILNSNRSGKIDLRIIINDIPDHLLPKRKPSKHKKRPPTRWWRTAASPMGIINKLKRKRRGIL